MPRTKEPEKVDLLKECYTDTWKRGSVEDFKATFCKTCLNATCINAKVAGMTPWQARITTQEDRLLINPKISDLSTPAHMQIHQKDFPSLLQKAQKIVLASQSTTWVDTANKSPEQIVEDAIAAMSNEAPPLQKVAEQNPLGLTVTHTPDPEGGVTSDPDVAQPVQQPEPVQPVKRKPVRGGIMVEDGPTPPRMPAKTDARGNKDPWAIDSNKVPVGGKFKMGGK